MKALDQIALFAFSLVMLFNVSAQEANEVLGVSPNKVSIENYENIYSSAINNSQNMVISCYINRAEDYNSYFTSTIKKSSNIGQGIIQDISNYQNESSDLNIMTFEKTDLNAATYRQMHQLKRERVVVALLNNEQIAIVSYDKEYYRQHILNN